MHRQREKYRETETDRQRQNYIQAYRDRQIQTDADNDIQRHIQR